MKALTFSTAFPCAGVLLQIFERRHVDACWARSGTGTCAKLEILGRAKNGKVDVPHGCSVCCIYEFCGGCSCEC